MPSLQDLPSRFQQPGEAPKVEIKLVAEEESKEMKTIRLLMQQNNSMRALINANMRLNKNFSLNPDEQLSPSQE